MIKRIIVNGIEVQIKTNQLKNKQCYFGDNVDIKELISVIIKRAKFRATTQTPEEFVINIYNEARNAGIKLYRVIYKDLIHDGATMTHIDRKVEQFNV